MHSQPPRSRVPPVGIFADLDPSELEALAHRWQIAGLLDEGRLSYLEIAERAGGSTATVTRVAQWLRAGAGGYRLALERARR